MKTQRRLEAAATEYRTKTSGLADQLGVAEQFFVAAVVVVAHGVSGRLGVFWVGSLA